MAMLQDSTRERQERWHANARPGWLIPVVLAWVCLGCGDDTGPVIYDLMPASASPGATIEIIGARFCGDGAAVNEAGGCLTPPVGQVGFGHGEEAVRALGIQGWLDERITVAVPNSLPAGATVVVVTVDGVASNAADFEVQ